MLRTVKLMIVAGVISIPALAHAELASRSPDEQYCQRLTELYDRYGGYTQDGPNWHGSPDVNAGVAIAMCKEGDVEAGIPILEKKLTDARVSLPTPAYSQAR
jgi:hypothetical protein